MGFSEFVTKSAQTAKAAGKILLCSRRTSLARAADTSRPIVIMGNGPSLAEVLADHGDLLAENGTMAVNFAAISPEFRRIRPRYYILADPLFFSGSEEGNLPALRRAFAAVDWPMTLLVPAPMRSRTAGLSLSGAIDVRTFNAVGVEGFAPFCRAAFGAGLAMPRPRNVLIPAIMTAIAMGYGKIVLVGADHSWLEGLSVTDDNEVVSVQRHFYAESGAEERRIRHEYRGYHIHDIVGSMAVAFKSYHDIADYATARGVDIVNATAGSYIDAFRRESLVEALS